MKRNIIFTAIAICLAFMLPGILGGMIKTTAKTLDKKERSEQHEIKMKQILNPSVDTVVVAQPVTSY